MKFLNLEITVEGNITVDANKPGIIVSSHPTIFDGLILRKLLHTSSVHEVTYIVNNHFRLILGLISRIRKEKNHFIGVKKSPEKTPRKIQYNSSAIDTAVQVLVRGKVVSIFALGGGRRNSSPEDFMKPGFSRIAGQYLTQNPECKLSIYPVRFVHQGEKKFNTIPRGHLFVNFSEPLIMDAANFTEMQKRINNFLTSHS